MACALGMKRLRETPPDERLRNAKRAVKRLRHEARYASCCYITSFCSGGFSAWGWGHFYRAPHAGKQVSGRRNLSGPRVLMSGVQGVRVIRRRLVVLGADTQFRSLCCGSSCSYT